MTTEQDFTGAEWQLLRDAPYLVYFAFKNAEAGAQEGAEQASEVAAFSATLAGYKTDNQLVADILAAQSDATTANASTTVQGMLQTLEQIRDILVGKTDSKDLEAFRKFLLDLGRQIAGATQEAWFSMGGNTSVAEQTILDKMAAALGPPTE